MEAVAERREQERDRDRRREQPEPEVDPGERRREHAGEGDVAERVAREHLCAQHDEVADRAAGDGDRVPARSALRMNSCVSTSAPPDASAGDVGGEGRAR